MSLKIEKNNLIGSFILEIALFFMIIDLANENTFYFFEISFVLLFLTLSYFIIKNGLKTYITSIIKNEYIGKKNIISMALYLMIDLINSLYGGNYRYIYEKYRGVASTLIIGFSIFYFSKTAKQCGSFKKVIMLSSGVLSAYMVLDYVLLHIKSLPYILRFSLRRDYNIFAIAVYWGFVFAIFTALKINGANKYLFLFGSMFIYFPTLFLSGSRRIMVMSILTVAITLIIILYDIFAKKEQILKLALKISSVIAMAGIITFEIMIFQNYMQLIYNTPDVAFAPQISKTQEMSALKRLETVKNASALEKRKII